MTDSTAVVGRQHVRIDAEDAHLLDEHHWYVVRRGYVVRRKDTSRNARHVYLHREIMHPPEGFEVDHINGDGLDNRRSNLRICNHQQNMRNRRPANRLGYKGIFLNGSRFVAMIKAGIGPERQYLGRFDTPEEAARAYDVAARAAFGEFARTNFPTEP